MNLRKIMLCIWWTGHQVVHYELLPTGQTVTEDWYSQQFECVQQTQKEPALVNRKGVPLLHDNARPHIARRARNTKPRLGWETSHHSPYSPDLAHQITTSSIPWTIIFVVNSSPMKQTCAKLSWTSLRPTPPNFTARGLKKVETRWQKVLDAGGDYFED
ncbi:histone-lysine N-methyltransferase SETMAR [Trichonephila clavipes]|nr:histone-lysine N-methyltransferase SETMAR [Trichonephila clavipes]